MNNPFPYEVLSNDSPRVLARFKTFERALAFYRVYCEGSGDDWHKSTPRLVNVDRLDGAEDSRCKDGLTEDERNAVEEVG